jgi:hypothetical protein
VDREVGDVVFDMVIGGLVAALFLGLPLGIIGLFIASILDRRHTKPPDRPMASGRMASHESAHLIAGTDSGSARRRRVIYGRHSVASTAKHHEPSRIRDQKV